MTQRICTLDGCDLPVKRAELCYGHYMKQWRYGDPHFEQQFAHIDLTGKRFGHLIARERRDGRWLCDCDCGASTIVRTGDLNRGSITSCGDRATHLRRDDVGVSGAHLRLRKDHGPARDHACVDCGHPAAHWSYDHTDPDERDSDKGPYSVKPEHYQPRCVPCHKRFDLNFLGTATPILTKEHR